MFRGIYHHLIEELEGIYSRFVQNLKTAKPTFSTRRDAIGTTAWACAICHLFENLLPAASHSRRVSDLKVPIGSLRNHDGDAVKNVDWKINLCFIYESRDTLKLFALFITVKAIAKLNQERNDQFEIKIKKISRRGSRSPDHTRFGHFTLLFCRGRQRNVPRIKTHVHSHCSSL